MKYLDPNFRSKFERIGHNPLILLDILKDRLFRDLYSKEISKFVAALKANSHYTLVKPINLNKLCCIEDWDDPEIKVAINELSRPGTPEGVHRKMWEWALGIVAMNRFGLLNQNTVALGIGSGKEPIIFYLANRIKHITATDLYDGGYWTEAPKDFPDNPKKYSSFNYRDDALTVMKMDGTNLQFPSNIFDLVFSFSSIEHFSGNDHLGAIKSMKETERVLRPGGMAIIATEFIINNVDHKEFFNTRTIYSGLLDHLSSLKLVEPLDLTISPRTLDTTMDYFMTAINWNQQSTEFKSRHPHILLRRNGMLWTSLLLVLRKS